MIISADAVKAATAALREEGWQDISGSVVYQVAGVAIRAAAPIIAKAERERIRQLAAERTWDPVTSVWLADLLADD
jgi:hypothetical protein